MDSISLLQMIIDAVNGSLPKGQARISVDNVMFALDSAIEHRGEERKVREKSLITVSEFPTIVSPLIDGGPNWVHVNLIPRQDGGFLITILVGASIQNFKPVINVSHELNRSVEVLY